MIKSHINSLFSQQQCFALMLPAVSCVCMQTVGNLLFHNLKCLAVNLVIYRLDKVMLSVYSQEYPLNIHPSFFNEESSKAEAACISEVDHGLGEGEGKTIDMGLFLGTPVQRVRERWHQRDHSYSSRLKYM